MCVCVHVNPQTETHPHKSLFEYIYLKADWALKPSCRDYLVQVMFGIWEETVKQEQFSRSHTWSSKTSQVQVLTHLPSEALNKFKADSSSLLLLMYKKKPSSTKTSGQQGATLLSKTPSSKIQANVSTKLRLEAIVPYFGKYTYWLSCRELEEKTETTLISAWQIWGYS